MRGKIAFGLAMLPLLFALLLRPENSAPILSPESESYPAELSGVPEDAPSRILPARQNSSRAASAMEQGRSRYPFFLTEIMAEGDPDRQNELLARAVESISDANLRLTLESLVDDTSPAAVELHKRLVRRWTGSDAPGAAAWAVQLPGGSRQQDALEQIAIAWANTDLAAAVAWMRALPEDEGKQTVALGLAYEAVRMEPLIALEIARSLPPTSERNDFLVHGISQWAIADSAAATSWATQVFDPILCQRLLASIAIAHAERNAVESATLAATLLDGEELDRAAVAIVQRWTQQSPGAAASWVLQFPTGAARDAAMRNLVALWFAQSPDDAANWLNGLPDGALRDVGVGAYRQFVNR